MNNAIVIPTIILSVAASAAADSKTGFSQLEFDKVIAAKTAPNLDPIAEILTPTEEEQKPAIDNRTARASLADTPPQKIEIVTEKVAHDFGYSWSKPSDLETSYLRPAVTGVEGDNNNSNSVQSSIGWSNDDAQSPAASCDRAKAIKEVLNRYTGSDEFAAAQCSETCTNKNEKAVLTSFEVKEVNGVSSSIVKTGKTSAYKIASLEANAAWPILEGASGYCSCLPVDCTK